MAKTASTTRTVHLYRDQGFEVWKCEYYFKRPGMKFGRRKDLLGFIDVLAYHGCQMIGIQDTSWGNISARKKKILASHYAWEWLQDPHREIHIVGWKAPDKSKGRHRWEHKVIPITLEDFTNGRPEPDESE